MARPIAVIRQEFATLTPVAATAPTQGVCLIGRATQETTVADDGASIKKLYTAISGGTDFEAPLAKVGMVITEASFQVENAVVTVGTTSANMGDGAVTVSSGLADLLKTGDVAVKASDGAALGTILSISSSQVVQVDREVDYTEDIDFRRTLTGLSQLDQVDADITSETDTDKLRWPGSPTIDGLAVETATSVYCVYVADRKDLSDEVLELTLADYKSQIGRPTPKNPLALAASLAFETAGNRIMYAIGTNGTTAGDYLENMSLLENHADVYALVPLCESNGVAASVAASMKTTLAASADPDAALTSGVPQRFRIAIVGGFKIEAEVDVVSITNGAAENPNTGADTIEIYSTTLFAASVQEGDIVSYDGEDGVVSEVKNQNRIVVGGEAFRIAATGNAAMPIDITRNRTSAQKAEAAIALNTLDNKRTYLVWQDVKVNNVAISTGGSQYLAAAVGGLIAGTPPHSPITGASVGGSLKLVDRRYTEAQLSAIAGAGLLVFKSDVPTSAPYCIHGVSSDTSALELRELSLVKVFDYTASFFQGLLTPFTKGWNINPQTVGFVQESLDAGCRSLQATNYDKLGTIILGAEVVEVTQDADYGDRLVSEILVTFPKPLNTVVLRLVSQ